MTTNIRMQRYRRSEAMRRFSQEIQVTESDFIAPLFVREGIDTPEPVGSLPGVTQWPVAMIADQAKTLQSNGVEAVILFGIPLAKDAEGSASYDSNGVIQTAIRNIKKACPDMLVIADCCLCEYTDHGHCGLMKDGELQTDDTVVLLGRIAVSYADAGVDIVAPSGMMDGMVSGIRSALDESNHGLVSIMSYAVKYASAFYGPFRDAAGSGDGFHGDRKHHQMQPAQRQEAIREAELDVLEGADFLIVKPASIYQDIIRDIVETVDVPVVAYHVSGEYAMIKAAAAQGIVDETEAFDEVHLGLKRSGVSKIISYTRSL
ncbi:porphobilinogen synthase [bacterium]|jgi:porphobilinogen synthase|nr:porphobilinogen synthase [bacterium]